MLILLLPVCTSIWVIFAILTDIYLLPAPASLKIQCSYNSHLDVAKKWNDRVYLLFPFIY